MTAKLCCSNGCSRQSRKLGLCEMHYMRARRAGLISSDGKRTPGTVQERFWRFVDRSTNERCWLWTGQKEGSGYGVLVADGKQLRAHRVSFEMHKGPIPAGKLIRHSCHVRHCVNPRHLSYGTKQDNADDALIAGRVAVNEHRWSTRYSNELIAAVRSAVGSQRQIAARFGLSKSQVGRIRAGRQRPVNPDGSSAAHAVRPVAANYAEQLAVRRAA